MTNNLSTLVMPDGTSYDIDAKGVAGQEVEITTQYVRITDLESGVYRLTYSGVKYLYYYGTTSTTSHTMLGSSSTTYNSLPITLYVNHSGESYWQWWYFGGTTSYPIYYYGYTTTSTGYTYSKTLHAAIPSSGGTAGYQLVGSGTSSVPVWQQPTGYSACSTAAATAAKTCSCSNFKLVTGVTITVKFTSANSAASPTLNVGGTGAKAIYYKDVVGSATNTWQAGEIVTFAYSGSYWYSIAYSKVAIDDGEL